MSKFTGVIVGGLEIAAGIALMVEMPGGLAAKFGMSLIAAGAGTLISGLGTLLSAGPVTGSVTAAKNPVAPWLIAYGQNCLGGTPVYINSWGDNDKYLDMVIVLAAHSCKDVYGLRFDGQRIQIDTSAVPYGGSPPGPLVPPSTFPAINAGTSFTPLQQTISCSGAISRINNIVTVFLAQNIPLLSVGDFITVSGVTDLLGNPLDVNGKWQVSNIVSQVFSTGSPPIPGSVVFQYISGGELIALGLTSGGEVKTNWPDYGRKVYMEVLTGKQTLGETFAGMIYGTPNDGNTGDLINPPTKNWSANCSLQGKTAVFLRLHYNDVYFSNGLPQISFYLHGKDDIYDPRTSPPSYGYSENGALCTADYLHQGYIDPSLSPPLVGIPQWGFGAAYGTEIPIAPLIRAANICDEQVQLAPSISGNNDADSYQTEPRYTCNGHFTLDHKRGEILQNLLTSMAGRITYQNGQWILWPAAWNGGGTSNVPELRPLCCLWGALCFAPDGFSPGDPEGVVLSSFFVGNGPLTFTVPDFSIPVSTDRAVRQTPPYPVDTPYPNQFVCQLQLGVNSLLGAATDGSWSIGVTVNGVLSTVIVTCTTNCWISLHGPINVTNTDIPIAGAGSGPVVVVVNPGDTVTIAYQGGTISPDHFLYPYTDANGNGAFLVGDTRPFEPCRYGIIVFDGINIEAPAPLPTIAGPIKWVPKRSFRDLFNGVKGTYLSPANNWQPSDFPPYCQDGLHGYTWSTPQYENDANLEADGGARLWKDIQLPFTISFAAAQRIAKIELLRNRYQGTGTIKFNMWGYQLQALDILLFTYPFFAWTDKILEVQKHRFLMEKSEDEGDSGGDEGGGGIALSTEIDVQESDPTVYDWSPLEQLGPQGYQESVLPQTSPNPDPTLFNLQMFTGDDIAVTGTDGVTRAAIQLDWPPPTDGWMTNGGHVEMQYQTCAPRLEMIYNGPGAVPLYTSPVPGSTWTELPNTTPFAGSYKTDIEMDLSAWYRFQIRNVNAAGVPSNWIDVYNPKLSSPPDHMVIAIQPFSAPSRVTPPDMFAVNGSL